MVLTDKSCERESHKRESVWQVSTSRKSKLIYFFEEVRSCQKSDGLLYDRANTFCMLTYNLYVLHTNIGVDIPMTAKYYHNLWVFMTIPYYGLTVN